MLHIISRHVITEEALLFIFPEDVVTDFHIYTNYCHVMSFPDNSVI
jgi:hypothetical protein